MNAKILNRRDFLRLSAMTAAGVALASCGPKSTPEVVKETVEVPVKETAEVEKTVVVQPTDEAVPTTENVSTEPVTIVHLGMTDLVPEELKPVWEELYPEITVEYLPNDLTRLAAMWAAGTPPDTYSLNGIMLPGYLIRGMVLNLQPYADVSDTITDGDLAPCHVLMRYTDMTAGEGDLYGVVKDWSTEFSLWLHKGMFEEAGVPLPSDEAPITYAELADLAANFPKKEGDRQTVWGLESQATSWGFVQTLTECCDQAGVTLYDDSFSKMNLVNNDVAKAVIKYWVDLMAADIVASPLNPSPSWAADEMPGKQLAMTQYGYWFNGCMRDSEELGYGEQVLYLTAPLWAGTQRRNPCAAGTNGVISSRTKYPDQTWAFFEWAYGKDPAQDRAKGGWGIPALKSLYPLMPNETEYDHQVQKVLQEDLECSGFVLRYNPFYDAQTVNSSVWPNNFEAYLRGDITFDEMVASIEAENNAAILDGITRLG